MVAIGKDLWRSSSPTPLLKQEHLEQVAQDCVQVGSELVVRNSEFLFFKLMEKLKKS